MTRIFSSGLLCLALAACAEPDPNEARNAKDGKAVSAVYMVGFSSETFPNALPSRQNDVRGRLHQEQAAFRDLAKASRWDVEEAKKAGLDAFAVWMFPRIGDPAQAGSRNARERLEALFKEMRKSGGLGFFPDYWWYRMDAENWIAVDARIMKSEPMPSVEAEMRRQGRMLADWARDYGDVWIKRDGRLLIGMQDHALFKNVPYEKASEWLFGPLGGRSKVYLALSRYPASGEISSDWLAGADAIIDWDANHSYGDSVKEAASARSFAAAAGKPYWPSFAPGFSQSRTGDATAPKIPTVYERLGIIAYRKAWLDAIEGNSPFVYLITWNDRSEDSEIMPTADHGRALQKLNKFFSDWHRAGKQPEVKEEELLLFHHPQVAEGLELPAGRLPTSSPSWALTPPTDYVAVCSFLKAPADLTVYIHKAKQTRRIPAGFHTWLLYHPNKLPMDAPAGASAIYPKEEDGLSITVLPEAFKDMELSVQVSRGEADLGRYFSHAPIVSAAGRADLGTIGDVFEIGR